MSYGPDVTFSNCTLFSFINTSVRQLSILEIKWVRYALLMQGSSRCQELSLGLSMPEWRETYFSRATVVTEFNQSLPLPCADNTKSFTKYSNSTGVHQVLLKLTTVLVDETHSVYLDAAFSKRSFDASREAYPCWISHQPFCWWNLLHNSTWNASTYATRSNPCPAFDFKGTCFINAEMLRLINEFNRM